VSVFLTVPEGFSTFLESCFLACSGFSFLTVSVVFLDWSPFSFLVSDFSFGSFEVVVVGAGFCGA